MNWWRRLWRRGYLEERLDSELRFHFEWQVKDRIAAGMGEAEARRQARLESGGIEGVKEECRDARGTVGLESVLRDLRLAVRTLRGSPVFTLAAVGTLALGIGANTAIFGLLDAVRLRSLPVRDPQQLVQVQIQDKHGWGISMRENQLSWALWEEVQEHHRPFSGVLAWASFGGVRIGEGAQIRRVPGLLVNSAFFDTLGVPPAAGAFFRGEDDQRGCADPGVVISYGLWQSEYGGKASAIGSRIVVEQHPYRLIGVAPASFTGLEVGRKFDVATPFCALRALEPDNDLFTARHIFWLTVLGRLAPGWSTQQASDYFRSISSGVFQATLPTGYAARALDTYRKFRLEAVPAANGSSQLRSQYSTSLWLLLGITGLVLLIACANLANLMLARASSRQREFAVRLALGASRGRLIQQALCESALVAAIGAVAGAILARGLSATIVAFLSSDDSISLSLSVDWRVLAFVAAVAIACSLLFGLTPALRATRIDPGDAIKTGGRGLVGDSRGFSFQRALVVVQIAVSLILIVGALLFVGTFRNLMNMDPGFHEEGVIIAGFDTGSLHLPEAEVKPFERRMLEEVRSIPGVQAAATTSNFIVDAGMWHLGVRTGGLSGQSVFTWVSPGQFAALGTPMIAGRDFNDRDAAGGPAVAIVNQNFARTYFGGANPIGKIFRTNAEPGYPETQYEIVGLVKDTRYFDLRNPIEPMAWAPAAQLANQGPWFGMYIRSSAPLAPLLARVRQSIARTHPEISTDFHVFRQQIEEGLVRERLMAALSGFFGMLAVLLAAIGLYGVIAFLAVRRRNEIGIRMALGATRSGVIGMVMKDAALLLAGGLAIGAACSLALSSVARSLLFGLSGRDPLIYIYAALLLAGVAALGSWLPAWRAARVDPMTALRVE